jgi:hypothetical protein
MKTCGTCDAWGAVKKGACDRVFRPRVDGIRFEIKVRALEEPIEVYLMTHRNFGCVLHAPKEKKKR